MYIKYEKDKIIGGLKKLEIIYLTKKKNFTHLVVCLLVDGWMVATFASRLSCLVVDDLWSFFFLFGVLGIRAGLLKSGSWQVS